MKIHGLFTLFFLLMLSQSTFAQSCKNVNGVPSSVNYDLTTTLTPAQNKAGKTVALVKNQGVNVQARCPDDSVSNGRTFRSYTSQYPVAESEGRWQFLKLDSDYLEAAIRIHDAAVGDIYPPENYHAMGYGSKESAGESFPVRDSNLVFKLKIVKPFIGTVNIPSRPMYSVYVTTGNNDPLTDAVYNIILSGTVTVPQSCEINAGQTIVVNFGSLYSGGFTHAGEKPAGVRGRIFNVPVKCSGTGSEVNLSMRLQATPDSHFSQAISSDNPDVGVVVETRAGAALTPNDASSNVPFVTDDSGQADIALQAYPVSTTGEVPAEGVFTALANLRVDFD